MKYQNMNRPSPFPGQMLTKPGFCFFLCVFILCYYCVFGILCVLVFLVYFYFVLPVPVQLIVWKTVPEMSYYVSRGTLSNCSLMLFSFAPLFSVSSSNDIRTANVKQIVFCLYIMLATVSVYQYLNICFGNRLLCHLLANGAGQPI